MITRYRLHSILALVLFLIAATPSLPQLIPQGYSPYRNYMLIAFEVVDSNGIPLTIESGQVSLLTRTVNESDSLNDIRHYLILSDSQMQVWQYPVDLYVKQGKEVMGLRVEADLHRIPFRKGSYHVPVRFDPLFNILGLNGTSIVGQSIDCFEVPSFGKEPSWPSYSLAYDSLRLASYSGRTSGRTHGYPLIAFLDWQGKAAFQVLEVQHSDQPNRALYRSLNGIDYQRMADTLKFGWNPVERILRVAFADSETGWSIVHTLPRERDSPSTSSVQATSDGGETWQLDPYLSNLHLLDIAPRDSERMWLLGFEPDDSALYSLRLYSGSRTARNVHRVGWPQGFDSIHFGEYPSVIPAGSNGVIIRDGRIKENNYLVNFDAVDHQISRLEGRVVDWELGQDQTTWVITGDASIPDLNVPGQPSWKWRWSPYRLHRISPDGQMNEVLMSDSRLNNVLFADEKTGAVIGDSFVLVTNDRGKSWHFIPEVLYNIAYLAIPETEGETRYKDQRVGLPLASLSSTGILTAYWDSPATLRLIHRDGVADLPVNQLLAAIPCAEQ